MLDAGLPRISSVLQFSIAIVCFPLLCSDIFANRVCERKHNGSKGDQGGQLADAQNGIFGIRTVVTGPKTEPDRAIDPAAKMGNCDPVPDYESRTNDPAPTSKEQPGNGYPLCPLFLSLQLLAFQFVLLHTPPNPLADPVKNCTAECNTSYRTYDSCLKTGSVKYASVDEKRLLLPR